MTGAHIHPLVVDAVLAHARHERPAEACGLLALDAQGTVRFVYCLSNADASPQSFMIAPEEFFGANRHAERQGWEIAGMFHSHPDGPPGPSKTDRARAPSSDWLYIVVADDQAQLYEMVGRRFRLVSSLDTNVGTTANLLN